MDIREIIRRYRAGQTIRSIASAMGYDRKTVRKYINGLRGGEYLWPWGGEYLWPQAWGIIMALTYPNVGNISGPRHRSHSIARNREKG